MSENYLGIITENYELVYTLHVISHGKVEIYRDTGVSKNCNEIHPFDNINFFLLILIVRCITLQKSRHQI